MPDFPDDGRRAERRRREALRIYTVPDEGHTMSTTEKQIARAYMGGYATSLVAVVIFWVTDHYFGEVHRFPWLYFPIAILTAATAMFLFWRNTRALGCKPDSAAAAPEANPAESDH